MGKGKFSPGYPSEQGGVTTSYTRGTGKVLNLSAKSGKALDLSQTEKDPTSTIKNLSDNCMMRSKGKGSL